jgi:diguanylate cyclase (GGDEF)-like protein/PAS domain S-box-containing protein
MKEQDPRDTGTTEHDEVAMLVQDSEAWFRSIFENVNTCIAATDDKGNVTHFNEAFRAMLGYDAAALKRMSFTEFTHPDDLILETVFFDEILANKRDHYQMTKRYFASDGRIIWVDLSTSALRDAQGHVINFVAVLRDISDRKMAEDDLRIAATAFEAQQGMIVTDANGLVLRVNRAFTQIAGCSAEETVGKTYGLLGRERRKAGSYSEMWEALDRSGTWQGEVWERHKNGSESPALLTISAVKNTVGEVTHYIASYTDISERRKAEEKIRELAFFDQLTGLPNRTLLLDRLKQAIAVSTRSGLYGALLLIDLDNFKTLNDSRGHDMGDMLLKQVSQRLTHCLRQGDSVARLGGDEFVAILTELNTHAEAAAAAIESVAEKLIASFNQPYEFGGITHHCTASIGITLFKGGLVTIDDLMKQADLAMYKSKAAGRNSFCFFDPTLEFSIKERAAMEKDLREALRHNQFFLHYQALMADDRLTGAEVLVRWKHPQRGVVPPLDFIPIAEENGLILALGEWVLETACTRLAVWATRPELAHLSVSVNVSARQFRQPNFVEKVLKTLKNTRANPQRLKLELTESLLVSNVEEVIDKMSALKARGIGFSLDDFGTGFSSLSYLKRLPFDQLKIDRSFVHDVLTDPNDASIARTIIALAQNLGLAAVAEGVETAEQRDFLEKSGCHAYQGYFFSRPLPVEDFEEFARRQPA